MDVLEAIRDRRSIRRYQSKPIPEDKLQQILEAGCWAPSANNDQPWRFVVVREEKVRKELARVATYGSFLAEAPVGIAVVIDPYGSTHPVEDGAAATQNMLLAAHAVGLGTCWIGSYGAGYEERAKEVLGIPRDRRLLSLISVGYPAESPMSSRLGLSKIVCYDRYDRGLILFLPRTQKSSVSATLFSHWDTAIRASIDLELSG
ncbi:MAG: nitroreductase family protein [Chloroflexi bacterium]|nr:nitroreductase family protein [Chloroflexota bacterium]